MQHIQNIYDGQGRMKGHRRAELTGWLSAKENTTVNATFHHFLPISYNVRPYVTQQFVYIAMGG